MPLVKAADAPVFEGPLMTAVGLAAPSRGSTENSVWRFTLHAGNPGHAHAVSREEIFIALSGQARATLAGETFDFRAGDALVIPADTVFHVWVPGDEPFEAVAILPVGAYAQAPGGDRVSPPWAQ
ncbi:cupin domain-containing protein [Nocardia sp. NBC_01503]|uniref:cupin domain-containing protein n=1 Tax=Nocardia sp. NBC_01503 TaxID=2975997 RepID=UPI002E7BDCBC|nr:cupin domain-containing protein [Nocardia sp. NBC_01503]WTL30274.1 cupin domain-containing protein [Nocardia sp. NBC_01503]